MRCQRKTNQLEKVICMKLRMRCVRQLLQLFLSILLAAARTLPTRSNIEPLKNEDPLAKIAALVVPYGYPLDVYNVETEDGFVLTLLRIPHDGRGKSSEASAFYSNSSNKLKNSIGSSGRPVVFLQHGLLDSAAGFLVNGPGKSLAFILADEGYDVWLGNVRGNTLSRAHVSLSVDDARFWQWSYDEMASYDLPTMIRYTLRVSGATSLRYVGHSQGTTVILAALSGTAGGGEQLPLGRGGDAQGRVLWGGEVERAALLAPVAVAKHISSVPLIALSAMNTDDMFSLLGLHEFLPSQEVVAALEGRLCALQPHLCVSFLAALCGYNPDNLDTDRLAVYLKYTPAGSSVQNMAHWAQAMRSRAPNTMSFFDYGTDCSTIWGSGRCNQVMYGSLAPPRYNLTAISTPLALFTGTQDRLSTPLDVEFLVESLGPGVVRLSRNLAAYEHLDFIWGKDARETIYEDVVRFLAGEA